MSDDRIMPLLRRLTAMSLTGALTRRHALRVRACVVAAVAALAGCSSVDGVRPFGPQTDPESLYFAVTLSHRAINLSTVAPYDTCRLIATARNAVGAPLSDLPAATFTSSDTTVLTVGPDGVVQAHAPGQGTLVIAELIDSGDIRHADTAIVNVTSDPPPAVLQDLSIEPIPPDRPVRAISPTFDTFSGLLEAAGAPPNPPVIARATDTTGGEIGALAVDYRSRSPEVANIDRATGQITAVRPGTVVIAASTTAYGITKTDSVLFTITLPSYQGILFQTGATGTAAFQPGEIELSSDGIVFWLNETDQQTDVIIEGPGQAEEASAVCAAFGESFCGSGDIALFGDPQDEFASVRVRRFPVPGVYTYRSSVTGATGRIVVAGDPAVVAQRRPAF